MSASDDQLRAAGRLVCRARITDACLHGKEVARGVLADYAMEDDGTFDGESVVCDACYVELIPLTPSGSGLIDELPRAIRMARVHAAAKEAQQERQNARRRVLDVHRFAPGNVTATAAVANDFHPVELMWLLSRHLRGDWGEVDPHDQGVNEHAIRHGARLMRVYTHREKKLWVITEADRSSTTFLYPDEY